MLLGFSTVVAGGWWPVVRRIIGLKKREIEIIEEELKKKKGIKK